MDIEVNTLAQIKAETGRDLDNQVDENTLVSGEKSNGTFGVFKLFAAIKNCIDNWITTIAGNKNFTGAVTINSKAVATTEAVNNALANRQIVYNFEPFNNSGDIGQIIQTLISQYRNNPSHYGKAVTYYGQIWAFGFCIVTISYNKDYANVIGGTLFNTSAAMVYTFYLEQDTGYFNYTLLPTKAELANYVPRDKLLWGEVKSFTFAGPDDAVLFVIITPFGQNAMYFGRSNHSVGQQGIKMYKICGEDFAYSLNDTTNTVTFENIDTIIQIIHLA